ncbi:MAG: bifunctional phosphoribosylaminoimidazolecarboxamide formyltransferase/IMP cyclohydrolase [Pyrinomonadaceae bacterium]|nr:bifunctional phosphoribosylaminoimidazolecarboxamide formyltransferase/IMP cyclohydrolase [Pyrinomonadaceae bacterium]
MDIPENNELGLRRIRRALISVSDKSRILDFARELKQHDVEIISTGGTAKALREAGIEVVDVSEITGFPEMMDGRIKTLHPKIHGALLSLRDNPEHVAAMKQHSIESIDMVVVNLYPFEQTIRRAGVTQEEAIEQIDIGGPAMIRSAAKNCRDVAIVVSPDEYNGVGKELRLHAGALSSATRRRLAQNAFQRTANYDKAISEYLSMKEGEPSPANSAAEGALALFPEAREIDFSLQKVADLRYGENPHQRAALYSTGLEIGVGGLAHAELLSGKEMSFNNYLDADAAWALVSDMDSLACAIIKHTNPAGVAVDVSNEAAYRRALATDPVSAFGGIVAFNRTLDEAGARAVTEIFTEVVIAPDYEDGALSVLRSKKNLRILRMKGLPSTDLLECRSISGGILIQNSDSHRLTRHDLKVVTERTPTEAEVDSLLFAWIVCKHTKSNAIVYAHNGQTVGVGAGQMSRVDSVTIGAMRAQLPLQGSVLASDAFFPFRDGIDEAAKHGITAVIQPGGSVRDEEVIAAANEHGLAMVFTGVRHFKH